MQSIKLPIHDIEITIFNDGISSIQSSLNDHCAVCGEHFDAECGCLPKGCTNAFDGIEALLLALACEGVDVQDQKIINAVEAAVDAAANNT